MFEVVEIRPENRNILKDQVVFFPNHAEEKDEYFFRLVEAWDSEKEESIVFLTNHHTFGATTIAPIYMDRWSVELFFKP